MNDCAFYLKKDTFSCLQASNRRPDKALKPHPADSIIDSIYFCQRVAIVVAVRHELQSMGDAGWRIFGMVRNE